MKSASQIRNEFFSFFEEKKHTIVPSDSLVPGNDPTLLFTNAGMNQFKDVFLGEGNRPYVRAVNTQKCLRVSGKHNDLNEVGYDTYHHTFFEMLGNWSFGDYFKKEAIQWAWELLTQKWGLDADRLYATVHEGDKGLGLDADNDALNYWKSETGIAHDHLMLCSSKENFWMMGETGPCGPCSEIHIDLRPDEERRKTPGIELVNKDDPRMIEIWNLVFIQYSAQKDGSLKSLPAQHVDTGMGLERIVAVLQNKTSNYDTDLFLPILDEIASLSPLQGCTSYAEAGGDDPEQEKRRIAMRVIADHTRTVAFAIADGVLPSNVGRGYVIRRILRRAVRYGYQTLDLKEPFMYALLDKILEVMGEQYPEIGKSIDYAHRVVRAEEESFLETLGTGLNFFATLIPFARRFQGSDEGAKNDLRNHRGALELLKKAFPSIKNVDGRIDVFRRAAKDGNLSGDIAFLLHDTYGFPVDLTQLMAREEEMGVEMERYNELMGEQKSRARAAGTFNSATDSAEGWVVVHAGDDSRFTGYASSREKESQVSSYRTTELKDGSTRYELVLSVTPFYAESGGQVGDTGQLRIGDELIEVLDTKKTGSRIVHRVDRLPADVDGLVDAQVDTLRRSRIVKHHSVTHLVHAALREILGEHVAQKGSLVAADHIRFDFSHFERVSSDELRRVEDRVNEVIQRNVGLQEERDVPIKEALDRGVRALFGEKYGELVRVITFDPEFSMELCGGIHVGATGEIGLFKFRSEGSVAAGVRRIEAVAGHDALEFISGEIGELGRVRTQFKSLQRPSDEEVADMLARAKQLEKEIESLRFEAQVGKLDELLAGSRQISDVNLIVGRLEGLDMPGLRSVVETLANKMGSTSVGIIGTADEAQGKVYLACAVSEDLISGRGLDAGKIVGQLARLVGGGGGGKPDLATAGGRQPENLGDALESAERVLSEMMM